MVVRREKVILELEDRFSPVALRAAGATKLLEGRLKELDGTSVKAGRGIGATDRPLGDLDRSARRAESSVDRLSGRLGIFRDLALTVGPAMVPISAAAVPALAGMATQLGLVAGAAGVAVTALVGIGDGLEALRTAQLDPTEENLAALRLEMEKLGPAGAAFVNYLDSITPQLKALQMTAREGFLPGLQEGIDSLLDLGPQVNGIVAEIAATMGDLAAESGEALSGPQFAAFFDMLDNRAAPLLREFGETVGNVVEGIANLFVGLEPLTSQFSAGLLSMTEDFAAWSRTLESNQGFQSFVDYVRQSGPQVVDLIGSIVQAVVGLAQAAAPLGQAVLPALTALADAFAAIASSPIGEPLLAAAAGVALLSRTTRLATGAMDALTASTTAAQGALTGLAPAANLAAMLVGLNLIEDAADRIFNTRFDQGSLARNLTALADGRVVDNLDEIGNRVRTLNSAIDQGSNALFGWLPGEHEFDAARTEIESIDQQLASLVESGNGAQAAAIFDQIVRQSSAAGVSVEDTRRTFDAYATALANVKAQSQGNIFSDFITSLYATGDAATTEAQALERSAQAARNKANATIGAFDAETQYRQALVAARQAAEANSAGIRGNSEAALANRGVLSGLASAWNNQSNAVRTNTARQRAARKAFIAAAEGMGVGSAKARELAREMLDIPKQVKPKVDVNTQRAIAAITGVTRDLFGLDRQTATPRATTDTSQAQAAIANLRAALDGLDGKTATTYIRTFNETLNIVRNVQGMFGRGSADGSTVPKTGRPYADRHPYLLADGEEVISNRYGQADRHRSLLKAINANRLADGGTAGAPSYTLDQRSELLQLQQSIRDLTRQLKADGKNRIGGLERRIAQLDRQQARRDLRVARRAPLVEQRGLLRDQIGGLRGASREFDVTGDMDFDQVRDELTSFRQAIRESGGTWTKRMGRMSDRLLDTSRDLDRERSARDALVEGLDEQQRAMDDLISTMGRYSDSVAGNFLSDPFGGARAASGGYDGPTPTLSPAALAARDQVDAMRRDLAGLRGWDDGSIGTAARASRLLNGIDVLEGEFGDEWEAFDRAKEAMAEAASTFEPAVSGLQALAQVLEEDTKRANDMAAALATLAGKGLDTTGPLGGLYSQLATSGDLGTAQELAALTVKEIAGYEQLFAQRQEAAAAVAAQATQAVYGEQFAAQQAAYAAQTAVLERAESRIATQTATLERLAAREEDLVQQQTSRVVKEVDSLGGDIRGLTRQIKTTSRRGRG